MKLLMKQMLLFLPLLRLELLQVHHLLLMSPKKYFSHLNKIVHKIHNQIQDKILAKILDQLVVPQHVLIPGHQDRILELILDLIPGHPDQILDQILDQIPDQIPDRLIAAPIPV